MKMTRFSLVAVALCSALLIPQIALAQEKEDDVEDNFVPSGAGIPIPDDTYDGTIASMACMGTDVPDGTVAAINVDLAVDHTWVGDLTVKVVPPGGTDADVMTLMSMPGLAESGDDGTDCCGDSSNMINTSAVNFADANPVDAEMMGASIDGDMFVCQDDAECSFFPNPDTGPGTNLAQFIGQPAGGTWQVCVGDSASGDTGFIVSSNVDVSLGVPTTNRFGLLLLLGLLAGGSLLVLRRKATVG